MGKPKNDQIAILTEDNIDAAKRELIHTGKTVEGVAKTFGYASKGAFDRAFKKVTGETPQHYIESYAKSLNMDLFADLGEGPQA